MFDFFFKEAYQKNTPQGWNVEKLTRRVRKSHQR